MQMLLTVRLPAGESIPVMGLGTWHLGEGRARRASELAALRLGIDRGLTLIDTAEMYGDGAAEALVGEAIAGRRDEVFLVSKVLPSHSTYEGTIEACRRSVSRLGTGRLDLYLLHWRGQVPLEETVRAFEELVRLGMVRYWGVSNFDNCDMVDLLNVPGGEEAPTDEVLYNLTRRGIEYDLLPTLQARGMLNAIPRASTHEHVAENRAAIELELTEQDLRMLDEAFPSPRGAQPLEML